MKQKGVLLLGGAGFLGRALARRLQEERLNVHVLALPPVDPFSQNITIHEGSLDDKAILESILSECGTIFHLASTTTPGDSAKLPVMEMKQNIAPTLHFLEVLQNYDDVHLIFVSSGGTLYGNSNTIPVDEDHPICPTSYHGAGKASLEAFLQVFGSQPNKNLTIIRPANLYGPGQPLRRGFGVIRTMLEHIRSGNVMEIWGDGEAVRDFLYIEDMVDACMLLMTLPGGNYLYNVGSGVGYSLNQVKEIIERVCGRTLRVTYRPQRQVDVRWVALDCSRLKARLGWQAKVSLEEGVLLTWRWLQNQ